MTDKEYWQAKYEAAKARDRNTDKCTENPYKRASDADKLKADIDRLNTIVERLDELLGKGINDYIMGIDGVEGIKDMWERSAVRDFAEKLRKRLTENRVSNDNVVINSFVFDCIPQLFRKLFRCFLV